MTNFDYLKKEKDFDSFVDIAIVAEKTYAIDVSTCIINCRRAMEAGVKWMYSVDADLDVPYQDKLHSLMNTRAFKSIMDPDIWNRMEFIRRYGNEAVHTTKEKTKDIAKVCLKNLFYFTDYIAYCYGNHYEEREFDESLLDKENVETVKSIPDVELQTLIDENKSLKEELSSRREQQQTTYVPKPLDLSEFKTRKLYIDAMLLDVGWIEGKDWINEVEILGMPNQSEVGYADYVLYDDQQVPLAIIEAKRTCKDPAVGRQQAQLYADLLEKKYKRRPVIFLTNGFDTRIIDNDYPERKVSSIYSKRDLEKYFNLRKEKSHLNFISVDKNIAGRYYQEAAIRAVCEAFDKKKRRKALLVMATGSGKTRTVIGLVDVLLQNGWVKNVLFLADRNSLVTQAKRSFVNLLPTLSASNLVEDKNNYNSHAIFSTYQTMIGCIDTVKDEGKKLFSCGHFDLIICDEAHRSIYNKYKDIFNYFDAPLVGLTATPKDEIDKNTYQIFELEDGVPTYGYDLAQAVDDGFLVDYESIECSTDFMKNGIHYDELDESEREEYENTFVDEDGNIPQSISPTAMNKYVFNADTIRKVFRTLFEYGIKIDYGQKIGKTIIFAKNHKHAEFIYEIFNKEYPELKGYAKVIDNHINYVQSAIDEFSNPNKLPQIAISVDMLDTGIDVPECVNLVFFKKVMSKAKFWQMIGRGTRLCPNLLDGKDKDTFKIFDFCGNFDFFRMNTGKGTPNTIPVQGAIFAYKFEIAFKLQNIDFQTDELKEWRQELVDYMVGKVKELDRNRFDVRQHLKWVELYSDENNYQSLSYEDCLEVRKELAPLILPDDDEIQAVRFDALMYGLELTYLAKKKTNKRKNDLTKKVKNLANISNVPAIEKEKELIFRILNTDYLDHSGIHELEYIRVQLRELIKYISKKESSYETDFKDDILDINFKESDLDNNVLDNYKAKIEYYIKKHVNDNSTIAKIHENKPLNENDLKTLEAILWNELGSKKDYYSEVGEKDIGEFVREIVGLDVSAAKEAFSKYLDERNLNTNQIYFVNQIVDYIIRNGMMKDFKVLQQSPFVDKGNVSDLFGESLDVWNDIRNIINTINKNASTL